MPAQWRKAALKEGASFKSALFGFFFGSFGMIFVGVFFPWRMPQDWRLSNSGVAATGEVQRIEMTSVSMNKTKVRRYVFTFAPAEGQRTEAQCYVTGEPWRAHQRVPVKYLPGDPTVARIEGARRSVTSMGMVFVLIFPALGYGTVAYFLLSRRRTFWLLKHGEFGEALVSAIEVTNTTVNDQPVHKISLQLAAAENDRTLTVRRFKSTLVSFLRTRMETKTPVFVLYDPAYPKRMLLPESWLTS